MLDGTRDWITFDPAARTVTDTRPAAPGPANAGDVPNRDPAWLTRPTPEELDHDAETAGWTRDNPHRLRRKAMREPVAMASAIYRMAEGAASSEDREVREVAWLVRQFFEDELWRFKTLDAFLGLRRQGGGLSRAAPVAARNTALRELATMPPWSAMTPTAAAADLRKRFQRYEGTSWPRERHHVEPPRPVDRVATLFWLIAATRAPGPMPNVQDLARHIEMARMADPK